MSSSLVRRSTAFPRAGFAILAAMFLHALSGCFDAVEPNPLPAVTARLERATPTASQISDEVIEDVEPVSDSLLLVAVNRGREIWMIQWDGSRKQLVARGGRGPGEVEGAVWIARVGPNAFATVDILLRRVLLWDATGRNIGGWGYELPSVTGVWSAADRLILRATRDASSMELHEFSASGAALSSAKFVSGSESPTLSCRYCPAAVRQDGAVAMSVSDTSYRLIITNLQGDSSRLVDGPRVAALAMPARQLDSIARMWDSIGVRLRNRGAPAAAIAQVEALAKAPGRSFLRRIVSRTATFDERGRLYLQRTALPGDSVWVDEFSDTFAFTRSIALPPGSTIRRLYSNRIILTRMLDDGTTILEEYSMAPSGADPL